MGQNIERMGWNAQAWCSGACLYDGVCPATQSGPINVGEQFKNCADVSVVDNGASGGGSAGSAVPTSAPISVPTTPTSLPTEQPTVSLTSSDCSGQPCEMPAHCRSKWGHCGASSDYCNSESIWTFACSGQGPHPEPEAEPEPEPAPGANAEPEPEAESEAEA